MEFCRIIAKHNLSGDFDHDHWTFKLDEEMVEDDHERKQLQNIINNDKKNESDFNIRETPDGQASDAGTYISRRNLATTFLLAFESVGLGQVTGSSLAKSIDKNNGHAKISAVASLGLRLLWDVDSGLASLVNYFHSNDSNVAAGALLGAGIVNCGIKNVDDCALALLGPYIDDGKPTIQIGAIMGLGLAYANTRHELILAKFTPILSDTKAPVDVIVSTAISLGLVYVSSCNADADFAITLALLNLNDLGIREPLAKLFLALGLLYLGKHKCVEAKLEMSQVFSDENLKRHYEVILSSCAYANARTGNIDQVERLLKYCQHLDNSETYKGAAILGIALIDMNDEVNLEKTLPRLKQLLQDGNQSVRRAVPLALALLFLSKPEASAVYC